MTELFPAVERGAELSACGLYRYRLWRRWGDHRSDVVFVMLNPSTADAEVDDPTIRRCMGFARSWGFEGIEVVNLYALRATKPKHLLDHPDPEGPGNVEAWKGAGMLPGMRTMVAAWGSNCHLPGLPGSRAFCTVAPTGYECLGMTKDGDPRHPLYVRADQPRMPFPADTMTAERTAGSTVGCARQAGCPSDGRTSDEATLAKGTTEDLGGDHDG